MAMIIWFHFHRTVLNSPIYYVPGVGAGDGEEPLPSSHWMVHWAPEACFALFERKRIFKILLVSTSGPVCWQNLIRLDFRELSIFDVETNLLLLSDLHSVSPVAGSSFVINIKRTATELHFLASFCSSVDDRTLHLRLITKYDALKFINSKVSLTWLLHQD